MRFRSRTSSPIVNLSTRGWEIDKWERFIEISGKMFALLSRQQELQPCLKGWQWSAGDDWLPFARHKHTSCVAPFKSYSSTHDGRYVLRHQLAQFNLVEPKFLPPLCGGGGRGVVLHTSSSTCTSLVRQASTLVYSLCIARIVTLAYSIH